MCVLSAAAIPGTFSYNTGFPFTTVLIPPSVRLLVGLICLFTSAMDLHASTGWSLAFMSAWTLLVPYIRLGLSQGLWCASPVRYRKAPVLVYGTGWTEWCLCMDGLLGGYYTASYSYWSVSMELWCGNRKLTACKLTTLAQ